MRQLHSRRSSVRYALALLFVAVVALGAYGQQPDAQSPPVAPQQSSPQQSVITPPKGQVLFERHLPDAPDAAAPQTSAPATPAAAPPLTLPARPPDISVAPGITDADRDALTITGYDLDARIAPATAYLNMRAVLTLRNNSPKALLHIALQISSQLTWQSVTLVSGAGRQRLDVAQHQLDTDADHTGKVSELVLTLPRPLMPGASLTLDTFYAGALQQSGGRLQRIGASASQASATDWDAITEDGVSLRGFGNVVWYPVASAQLFLGDGAQLFDAIGRTKLREASANIHLHLAIETLGDPPVAAYFCGRRQELKSLADNANVPVVSAPGIAVADFSAERLGFRIPSLFVIAHPETRAGQLPAPLNASLPTSADFPMLAIESENDAATMALATEAERVAPLLQQWLGVEPLTALSLLDHAGQPFEDGPLLVAPLPALAHQEPDLALAHSLTHAWIETGQPWIDEGLAQFFTLLWIERAHGRPAALAQLADLLQPLALLEPEVVQGKPTAAGQPLIAATTEVYYRRKAAAVWWMLRGITGEDALQRALQQMRARGITGNQPQDEALILEALLEKACDKDLHWFFDDWVLHDRGLPDLTLADVTPRSLPAASGRSTGWLVAVTVRNDGAAVADVPVIIHTDISSNESRLRVPGFSTVTTRIVVEAQPTEVVVNDGSVPEQRASTHSRNIVIQTR